MKMNLNQSDTVFEEAPDISSKTLVANKTTISPPLQPTGLSMLQFSAPSLLEIFTFRNSWEFDPSTETINYINLNPWDLVDSIAPFISNLHPYLRADIEIQLRLTSQFQQVGALIAYFVQQPVDAGGWGGSKLIDTADIGFEYPHQIINFGENSTTTLRIPWNSVFQMLKKDDSAVQSIFKLLVLDKMKVATGVTAVARMQVYWRLVNVQLSGYLNAL